MGADDALIPVLLAHSYHAHPLVLALSRRSFMASVPPVRHLSERPQGTILTVQCINTVPRTPRLVLCGGRQGGIHRHREQFADPAFMRIAGVGCVLLFYFVFQTKFIPYQSETVYFMQHGPQQRAARRTAGTQLFASTSNAALSVV